MSSLFQAGLLRAFLQGVYDGDYSFEQLAQQGNFGLGTLNGVDGEMVAVDGQFYRIDAQGVATIIPSTAFTPFALVSPFEATTPFTIHSTQNLTALNALLDSHIPSPNIFYMMRIDGEFEWMSLRSETCQMRPYQPLLEALPKAQHCFELQHTTGTLVVTRCPSYSAAFTIPGYHYHYIDEKRTTGGHVFDLKLKEARVMINPIRHFNMALFDTAEFDNASLELDTSIEALTKIE